MHLRYTTETSHESRAGRYTSFHIAGRLGVALRERFPRVRHEGSQLRPGASPFGDAKKLRQNRKVDRRELRFALDRNRVDPRWFARSWSRASTNEEVRFPELVKLVTHRVRGDAQRFGRPGQNSADPPRVGKAACSSSQVAPARSPYLAHPAGQGAR